MQLRGVERTPGLVSRCTVRVCPAPGQGTHPHRLHRVDVVPHSQGRTWTEPGGPEDPARLGLAPSPVDLPKG